MTCLSFMTWDKQFVNMQRLACVYSVTCSNIKVAWQELDSTWQVSFYKLPRSIFHLSREPITLRLPRKLFSFMTNHFYPAFQFCQQDIQFFSLVKTQSFSWQTKRLVHPSWKMCSTPCDVHKELAVVTLTGLFPLIQLYYRNGKCRYRNWEVYLVHQFNKREP